ncbi:F-box domain protein [Aspergillus heteromorphus CBS 117.55]|uniref:F-box domain protein n=1 Tax=Aspergillus heteromorphus CBS 117.55 TaxID=1448321 RepID=A0A317WK95_9EURO|nr:F-box domain protein [Aspergillus heteromorphus CBS 117.55]PWY86759.1 F-box domain protein [Aspergillus heteromorphus CBS 117.55]
MAFDCYCALCGVGFCGMHIEAPSETATERRRRWIEKRCRALQAGRDIGQVSEGEETEDPVRSYDPRIVGWDNISWLYKAHCLGWNESAPAGTSKAFISDEGYYADSGELVVKARSDRDRPRSQRVFSCYGHGSEEAPGPVLPFHWCCFEILTRTLTGASDTENVNMDVLYNVMTPLCNMSSSALQLSYGNDVERAQGRYWECIPGAEYCATHPTNTPGIDEYIQTALETNSGLKTSSAELNLRGRDPTSPFGRLPLEIVYQICMFLPGDAVKALGQASLSIHLVTQDNLFWKKFMQRDMPWLWELQGAKSRKIPQDVNFKRLYMWLNRITAPRYGMDDVKLIGVANRRRIWGVCEELADRYHESLPQPTVSG